jgi:hypothetical protein
MEGMDSSTPGAGLGVTPYFEQITGIAGAPKKDAAADTSSPFSTNSKTSTYASRYYEQFVPYAETLATQLAGGNSNSSNMSGTNAALIEKLNYIIHMLEEKKDEKTGHVIEELVLYCFLGVFIIFVVDTFTHAASGSITKSGGMFGGGSRRPAQYYRR